MTLVIVGALSEREVDYATTPTLELLQEAEQYIFDLIDWGLEAYLEKRANKQTNKHFHLYFGHSKNEELKKMRYDFLKPLRVEKQKQKELEIQKKFNENLIKAKEKSDTYEAKYEITQDHWTWIFIGMEKPGKGRDNASFGYWMEVDQAETPQFFKYCKDNLPHYKPN